MVSFYNSLIKDIDTVSLLPKTSCFLVGLSMHWVWSSPSPVQEKDWSCRFDLLFYRKPLLLILEAVSPSFLSCPVASIRFKMCSGALPDQCGVDLYTSLIWRLYLLNCNLFNNSNLWTSHFLQKVVQQVQHWKTQPLLPVCIKSFLHKRHEVLNLQSHTS